MALAAAIGIGGRLAGRAATRGAVGAAARKGAGSIGAGGVSNLLKEGNAIAKRQIQLLERVANASEKGTTQLGVSAKILQQGLKMMWRPFGDALGLIFRPFAIGMLRYGLKFYKWFLDNKDTFTSLLNITDPIGQVGAIGDLLIGKENKQKIKDNLSGAWGWITELNEKIDELRDRFWEWLGGVPEWLTEKKDIIIDWVKKGFEWFSSGQFAIDIFGWLKDGFDWFRSGQFSDDLRAWLKQGWDHIKLDFFTVIADISKSINSLLGTNLRAGQPGYISEQFGVENLEGGLYTG